MNSSFKQRLIDIDIAQSCDQVLIEQGTLDRPAGLAKSLDQLLWPKRERLGPHLARCIRFPQPPHAAEAARVAEANVEAVEVKDQVRVLDDFRFRPIDGEPS